MINLLKLTRKAREYAEYYRKQGVDAQTVEAVYVSHLAYLINDAMKENQS